MTQGARTNSFSKFISSITDEDRYFTINSRVPTYTETFAELNLADVSLVDFYDAAGTTNSKEEKDQEIKFLELFAEHRFGKSYSALTTDEKNSLKMTIYMLLPDGKIDETSLENLQAVTRASDTTATSSLASNTTQFARAGGDPIFTETDGGIFEVKGEAGKTYNFLSDKGFQINTLFGSPTENSPYTFVEKIGVTSALGGEFIFGVDAEGDITVDGKELTTKGIKSGDIAITQQADGTVTLKRESKEGEADGYTLSFSVNSENYLDVGVETTNYGTDNVDASGLLGVTFDDDNIARNGIIQKSLPAGVLAENIIIKDGKFVDKTTNKVIDDALYPTIIKFKKEGGGAIEDKNGNIVEDGSSVIQSYEVDNLLDTEFNSFTNAYDAELPMNKYFQVPNWENYVAFEDFIANEEQNAINSTEDYSGKTLANLELKDVSAIRIYDENELPPKDFTTDVYISPEEQEQMIKREEEQEVQFFNVFAQQIFDKSYAELNTTEIAQLRRALEGNLINNNAVNQEALTALRKLTFEDVTLDTEFNNFTNAYDTDEANRFSSLFKKMATK